MYALRTKGKVVAKAQREYLGCLLLAFNVAPQDLTLLSPQGRVLLTAKTAVTFSQRQRFDAVSDREKALYDDDCRKAALKRLDVTSRTCPSCGAVEPTDQSCICFDNGCQ